MKVSKKTDTSNQSKILVVDQNAETLSTLWKLLSGDYTLIFSKQSGDTMRHLRQKPDLILMDSQMPPLNGWQLPVLLKSDPITALIPMILLLQNRTEEEEIKGLELGAVDTLSKPLHPEIARIRIKHQLDFGKQKSYLQQLLSEKNQWQTTIMALQQKAKISNQIQADFLTQATHEIRSPMTAILGMTEMALSDELSTTQRERIHIVERSSQQLLSLINNILDISKIEAGGLHFEEIDFDICGQIENVCETLAIKANKKNLDLLCDIDPTLPTPLVGDPHRFCQIVINLLDNAIKFTQKGTVTIAIKRTQPPENLTPSNEEKLWVRFSVSDTGIGLEPQQIESIFQTFTQADVSTARRFGGSGLGLAICKQLVTGLGGEIQVASQPDKGSVFYFSLPFGMAKQKIQTEQTVGESRKSRKSPINLSGIRVLILDNRPNSRSILETMLTHYKATIQTVPNGNEVMYAIQHPEAYDVLLFDTEQWLSINTPSLLEGMSTPLFQSRCLLLKSPLAGALAGELSDAKLSLHPPLNKPVRRFKLLYAIRSIVGQNNSEKPTPIKIQPPSQPTSLNVLLADDQIINQDLAANILKKRGHRVTVACNGLEVLEKVRHTRFDLLLLDIQMPEMDGFETAQAIRQAEKGSSIDTHLPIVALSAQVFGKQRGLFLRLGIKHFIEKPYRSQQLITVVSRFSPMVVPMEDQK